MADAEILVPLIVRGKEIGKVKTTRKDVLAFEIIDEEAIKDLETFYLADQIIDLE